MKDLVRTLESLSKKYSVSIMIKDFTYVVFRTPPMTGLRGSFNVHNNEYCALIASNNKAHAHCVKTSHSQLKRKIRGSANPTAGFWGVCYAGVRDYVIPLLYDNIVIGAMIVGSFPCGGERAESSFARLSRDYGFDTGALRERYRNSLAEWNQNDEVLQCEFKICALYLQELIKKYVDIAQLAPYLLTCKLQTRRFETLERAVEYIKGHLGEELTIGSLAAVCFCSKSTISHLFSEMLGMGVSTYITNERVFYAQKLLRETSLPISEISERCGFCSPTYFANVFRGRTQLTAGEYRKKYYKRK